MQLVRIDGIATLINRVCSALQLCRCRIASGSLNIGALVAQRLDIAHRITERVIAVTLRQVIALPIIHGSFTQGDRRVLC